MNCRKGRSTQIVNEVQTITNHDQNENNSHTYAVEMKGREDCGSENIIPTGSADVENETFYILSNDPKLEAYLLEEPANQKIEVLELPSKIVSDEQSARKIYPTASNMETHLGHDFTKNAPL